MPDPNAGDGGWIAAAVVSLLGMAGGLIAWLYGRGDRRADRQEREQTTREAKLSAWHNELIAREELFTAQQAAFQATIMRQLAAQDEKIDGLERENERYRAATPLLIAAVHRNSPNDPVLSQVSTLLSTAWPLTADAVDGSMDGLLKNV